MPHHRHHRTVAAATAAAAALLCRNTHTTLATTTSTTAFVSSIRSNKPSCSNAQLFSTSSEVSFTQEITADQKEAAPLFPHVTTRGKVVGFIPSANGDGGLAAVKLSDDVVLPPSNPSTTSSSSSSKNGGMESRMFGAPDGMNPTVKKQKRADVMSEDFTGKTIQFPNNGGTGIIVAQRPPIAFVLTDSISGGDPLSIASEKDKSKEEDIMTVNVLNTLTTIQVSDKTTMGSVVDCFGNAMKILPDGSTILKEEEDDMDVDYYPPRAIFAPIPKVSDIALINQPLLTGTTMIDALAPLGKGQNMLFIGEEKMDCRGLAMDAIATQIRRCKNSSGSKEKKEDVKCVYALTTTDKTKRLEVVKRLEDLGLLDDVVVVSMRDESMDGTSTSTATLEEGNIVKAAEAVTVAATACSIAESYALHGGYDTFVVVDNIDQHKSLWDQTTKVLVDVYGVDAVVKDDREGGASSEMRAFYSSLIQRSAMFNLKKGGGSVTLALLTSLSSTSPTNGEAEEVEEEMTFVEEDFEQSTDKVKARIALLLKAKVPLTSTNLRKIQIPLPNLSMSEKQRLLSLQHMDDLISMSDGQVWLDEKLATVEGRSPPMDPQRSITRVGVGADTMSRADAKALRGLIGGLRFELAQASNMDGAEMKLSSTMGQLRRRDAWLLAMHRDGSGGKDLSEEVVSLLAASTGKLDKVIDNGGKAGTDEGRKVMTELVRHVRECEGDAMREVDDTLDMSEDVRGLLVSAIESYFAS